MCYWLIYIEGKDEQAKLTFLARPFSNLDALYDWLSKSDNIVAIAITQSIYRED